MIRATLLPVSFDSLIALSLSPPLPSIATLPLVILPIGAFLRTARRAQTSSNGPSPPTSPTLCVGMKVPDSSLVFADFDVVVDDDGEDDEDPHGEDTHSGDGFRNQARQNRPSTAED